MNTPILPLVELTLKGTAVLLTGYGGAAWLARSSSAAQRSLCWLAVFATLLFLPLALIVRPMWSLPVQTAAQSAAPPDRRESIEGAAAAPVIPPRPSATDMSAWFAVYACGVAGVLGFRLLGAVQLWKLRRDSSPDTEGQATVDGWRKDHGMRRRVQVCSSPRVAVPMTFGAWRPVILLPGSTLQKISVGRTNALRHEFAHIRQCDAARRWLGTMAAALWWPHPLVWAAFRAWKLEQERSCDDAVLNSGAEAADYAQQLLDAARLARLSCLPRAGALIMAMPGGLETRLRSVTAAQVNRAPTTLASLLPICALAVAATLCGIALQTQSATAAPPDAEGTALMHQAEAAIIPQINARESTVAALIAEITKASGIKIFYALKQENEMRISLTLKNVPASEAIQYVASLSNLSVAYKRDGVYLTDLAQDKLPKPVSPAPWLAAQAPTTVALITKEWKLPPGFPRTLQKGAAPRPLQEELTAAGVVFPPGSSATYTPDKSRLIVNNTQANLDLIDALVKASGHGPAPR